jgi:hypothetical protein
MVGFTFRSWFPLQQYAPSAAWQVDDTVVPAMIVPRAFLADEERLLREGEVVDDDVLRGASPSRSILWLSAMLGCQVRVLPGSTLAQEQRLSWPEVEAVRLDTTSPWFTTYVEFIDTLVAHSNGRYPVSHASLVGPSDLHAALRGHGQSIEDVIDDPRRASQTLWRMADCFQTITEEAWKRIPLFHGGYYDAQYQLWAPGPIIRLQEDATALYSPRLYREFLQPVDRHLASQFECAFIHLHSTSLHLLDLFLEVDEIRCFEVNYEKSGPPLPKFLEILARVQRADRPLVIRGSYTPNEIDQILATLDSAGLYLIVMVETMEEVEAIRPHLGM